MKRILELVLSAVCSLAVFVLTFYCAFTSQMAFFGPGSYDDDAGAQFGLVLLSLFFATVAGAMTGVLLFGHLKRGAHLSQHPK
jgi:hypothetical protein